MYKHHGDKILLVSHCRSRRKSKPEITKNYRIRVSINYNGFQGKTEERIVQFRQKNVLCLKPFERLVQVTLFNLFVSQTQLDLGSKTVTIQLLAVVMQVLILVIFRCQYNIICLHADILHPILVELFFLNFDDIFSATMCIVYL